MSSAVIRTFRCSTRAVSTAETASGREVTIGATRLTDRFTATVAPAFDDSTTMPGIMIMSAIVAIPR